MSNKESTTMIDVKRGRELLAKATEPGKPWSTSHRADGTASIYTSGPGPLRGIIDVAETRSNDADLTVWLHNNAEALLSAAERVEEAQRVLHAVAESMSEHAYQELASALEAPPRIDVASQSDKLTAAERRVAELEAKNAQLAHEGEVLGALYVGDAPPKDAARAIVERAQAAERARDEAVRDRDTWRSACDAAGADLLAVSEALGCVHEQSMGPLLHGSREELVEAIRGLQESRGRAQTDSAEACGRMRQQKAAMREERDEAVRRVEAAEAAIRAYLSAHEGPFPSAEVKARQGMRDVLATLEPKGGK